MIYSDLKLVGFSGEKTSAKYWSKYVEVKGRVRLDAFENFLQELPLSRSRTVMVFHFLNMSWILVLVFILI